MRILLLIILFCSALMSEVHYFSFGKKVTLIKLKESRLIGDKQIAYYQNGAGQKLGVSQEVLAKCTDIKACEALFIKYDLKKVKNLTKSIFLISLEKGEDPFALSNKLYKEDAITFAHPNFLKPRVQR